MDPTRKANRAGNEVTLQYQSRQETLGVEELIEDKLKQLQAFIQRLEQTPPGSAEIRSRTKLFGACKRVEGETSGQYYGRLRHWLDRATPHTKSPLHPPRQTDD
jgi:hypothetical protein